MIMNLAGGGGGSEGVSYRMVGLSEIYFNNYWHDYSDYGYRTFGPTANGFWAFYFPGKVAKITSFKYVYQTSHGGTWSAEQVYSGDWVISGNKAYPTGYQFRKNYYYRITEFIAFIEDSVSNGTVGTITITKDELNSGNGVCRKTLGGNNIISFTGIPENYAPYIRTIEISGNLLSITGSYYNYMPAGTTLTFTVHIGENTNQGITYTEGVVSLTQNSNRLTFYTGFDPNYVVISAAGTTGAYQNDGIVAASYAKSAAADPTGTNAWAGNTVLQCNNGMLRGAELTYTANRGDISIGDASTYPESFRNGYYRYIAMK